MKFNDQLLNHIIVLLILNRRYCPQLFILIFSHPINYWNYFYPKILIDHFDFKVVAEFSPKNLILFQFFGEF